MGGCNGACTPDYSGQCQKLVKSAPPPTFHTFKYDGFSLLMLRDICHFVLRYHHVKTVCTMTCEYDV